MRRSLVLGSNAGSLAALVAKASNINDKHGPFTCMLCLGDLFSSDEPTGEQEAAALLEGSLAFPIPTYFYQGDRILPAAILDKSQKDDGQITDTLSFLGERTGF
jgi:hypothetical protein